TLSMIDKVTQPLKAVQAGVTQFAETSQQAFKNIAVGGAGLAGSVFALKNVLDPALAIQDSLDMAKVTGVDDGAMKKITDEALTFSAQYGKSAVQFVESSLSIRKAISGISDNELPQLTKISNITASALKTTAEESNAYMGKMFSQFQGYADSVGKVTFAEELAGKAVIMSQTFGTSMAEITDLMEGARSAGTQFGVGIDEQLAVLGELQRSLGTESSSAYESFLSGATDGAKKLGLSFVNASGQMLTMPEMLEKLQGKYGKSIAGNLKAQKEIEDAFGDSAIVVKSLFNNVEILRKNITALGGDDGMKRATEMASMLANPWERLL
ncbi:phage tail tape measure protein, partial [Proteus mirabilis]|uniref:phage tail tape measure protein n=1 Tax=Proteus mirabilis TaxID=584 RepID=UPI001FAE56FE